MAERNGGSGIFLVGFLLGAAAGVAAALLMTPRSGQETVDEIRERSIQLKLRAEELGNQSRQRVVDQIDRARDSTRDQLETLDKKAYEVTQQAQVKLQETIDRLEETQRPVEGEGIPLATVAEELQQVSDSATEELRQTSDTATEQIQQTSDAVSEEIQQTSDAVTKQIQQTSDAVSEEIQQATEELEKPQADDAT